MSKISNLVTPEDMIMWLIIFFLFAFFLYKELPGLWQKLKDKAEKDRISKETAKNSEKNQIKLQDVENRLQDVENSLSEHEKEIKQHNEEMEIIMRAMLGVLRGLQELGTNGPTKAAEAEIENYLNKKAHGGK